MMVECILMMHAWQQHPDEFLGITKDRCRIEVWHCSGCDKWIRISEYLNENLDEYLSFWRFPKDCETAIVRHVLEL